MWHYNKNMLHMTDDVAMVASGEWIVYLVTETDPATSDRSPTPKHPGRINVMENSPIARALGLVVVGSRVYLKNGVQIAKYAPPVAYKI
jgi:hypothetical protein